MTINTHIADGKGSKTTAKVDNDHALYTTTIPYPPLLKQKTIPFRQYLTLDGLSNGIKNMGVDGSVTNQDFYINSNPLNDRYISNISFLVGYGTSGRPRQWADGSDLPNGSRLFYESESGEVDIHDEIKANQDLFRLSFAPILPRDWELRHVYSNNDFGYFISMDLRSFGLPFGIKLDRGSNQKIIMRIRDDAGSSADEFDAICYGFDRFE